MQWFLDNWVLILFGGGMILMHLFGHGHGGHGRGRDEANGADQEHSRGSRRATPDMEAGHDS